MTRQISEVVRIDLRGEGVLNSKAEYSRCRIPRLVIDQENWRMFKKKEQKEIETIQEPIQVVEEDGMEVMEMLEAEQELGMMESKNKVETKRKANADGKPPIQEKETRKYGGSGNVGGCGGG